MSRVTLLGGVLLLVTTACAGPVAAGPAGTGSASPAPAAATTPPTFTLTLDGYSTMPEYASDPAAGLNTCSRTDAGGWTYLYGGGTPFVSVDLSLFSGATDGSDPSDFDLDVGPPDGTAIRLVPSGRREGAKGSGTATISETPSEVVITVEGAAITRLGGPTDLGKTDVTLTAHCPTA